MNYCKLLGHDPKTIRKRDANGIDTVFYWFECQRCKLKWATLFHPGKNRWIKTKPTMLPNWTSCNSPEFDAKIYHDNGTLRY